MNALIRFAGWVGFLSVLVMTESSLTEIRADDSKPCPGPSGLSLVATAGKPTYTLYEPVMLTYTVRNRMDCRVETGLYIEWGRGIQIVIEDRGKQIPFNDGMSSSSIIVRNRALEPGDADTGERILFYNDAARQLAFPRPGQYRILVRAHVWNNPDPVLIESNPVVVTIRDVRDQERKAIDSLGSIDALTTLFRDGVKRFCAERSAEGCGDDLRAFLRRHPDSAYAPVVTFYLGISIGEGVLPIGADGDDASTVLNRFLERWPGHPFESLVMRTMVEESQRAGRREEAMERLHQLEGKYPEHVSELRELRSKVERTGQ
ncbi:MAG TPA: hypothetical protein VFC25_01665 [Verrucomicrobiae bacterium]|nr:hypothetical protein [Verrucomicrobiae bacterium]